MLVSQTESTTPRADEYHWGWVGYFISIHVVGVVGIVYAILYAPWATICFAVVYYFLCHLSITIGAHRLYSHRSFKTSQQVQYILVLLFSGVMQGPIIWWAGKHRLHHEKSDVPGQDPHTPKDGFWHAHGMWVMKKTGLKLPPGKHLLAFGKANGEFAPANWQTAHHLKLGVLMAFLVPVAACSLWGDPLGGLLVGACTRLMFQYHFTWIVNSLGHFHGETEGGTATNQPGILGWMLAIMTVGESNHAGHHTAAGHYRIGRRSNQLDPGAWVIEQMVRFKLAHDLKKRAPLTE